MIDKLVLKYDYGILNPDFDASIPWTKSNRDDVRCQQILWREEFKQLIVSMDETHLDADTKEKKGKNKTHEAKSSPDAEFKSKPGVVRANKSDGELPLLLCCNRSYSRN